MKYCSAESLINTLNPELNPIYYLLALLAHHFLHVSRIRVNGPSKPGRLRDVCVCQWAKCHFLPVAHKKTENK